MTEAGEKLYKIIANDFFVLLRSFKDTNYKYVLSKPLD